MRGVVFQAQLAAPPPGRSAEQVAYVWEIDRNHDSTADFYVFVDLPPDGRAYRATLERNTPEGLVTINDRLPFVIEGSSVRVFVPAAPHIATDEEEPTLEWYMYTYYERVPQQDELSDAGRYFILTP